MTELSFRFVAATLGAALLLAVGCETSRFDHTPPAGQGTLAIDNRTDTDIHVYINGYYTNDVGNYNDQTFDLDPGTYRVVLDEESGDRSFYDDVDVLEDQLTVLEVTSASATSYSVRRYID